jgi:hypothetical protein
VGLLLLCCAASCSSPLTAKRDLSGETISLGVNLGDALNQETLEASMSEAGRTAELRRALPGGGYMYSLGDGSATVIFYPFSDDREHVGTVMLSGSLLMKATSRGGDRGEALSRLRQARQGKSEDETLAEEVRLIGRANRQLVTLEGVRLGSARDEVIAAYGAPDLQGEKSTGEYLYYEGRDRTLAFRIVRETVAGLMLLNPGGTMPPMESLLPSQY